jgi:hypothetical protein
MLSSTYDDCVESFYKRKEFLEICSRSKKVGSMYLKNKLPNIHLLPLWNFFQHGNKRPKTAVVANKCVPKKKKKIACPSMLVGWGKLGWNMEAKLRTRRGEPRTSNVINLLAFLELAARVGWLLSRCPRLVREELRMDSMGKRSPRIPIHKNRAWGGKADIRNWGK